MVREPLPKLESDLDADGEGVTITPSGLPGSAAPGSRSTNSTEIESEGRERTDRALTPASRNQRYTVRYTA